jgi:pilus biogenesis lipoprotein CpaD
MSGGAYQAAGQQVAPVVVAFIRHEARAADCPGWGEIDPRRTASNMNSPRFGCAQAGNLAAMVVDPGDLTGDRRDAPAEAARAQRGIDQMREGTLPEASGTVAGGN